MKIIAEIGASHCGDYDIAAHLITEAERIGADAVKLQCYTPSQMAIPDYIIQSGPWAGRELQDLYREACTPRSWFPKLFDLANQVGMELISSVYHPDDVAFLETLGCEAYKVASFEAHWGELIDACLDTGKPVYVSTGLLSAHQTTQLARRAGLTLMHCVSAYPAKDEDMNLAAIGHPTRWNGLVGLAGLSDHTTGSQAAIIAMALGATCVEKHIHLAGGLDQGFALTVDEFADFVVDIERARTMLGTGLLHDRTLPESSLALRRSLHPDGTVRRPWSGVAP